jgi:ATPase subunit of ABC transporter with duplicated ATPase domains
VGVLGVNGVGKSTLMRIIARRDPNEGRRDREGVVGCTQG